VHRCVGPSLLLLADLGQGGVALGLVGQHLDDGRIGPLGLSGLLHGGVAPGQVGEETEVPPRQLDGLQDGSDRAGLVALLVVGADNRPLRLHVVGLEFDRQRQLRDGPVKLPFLQVHLPQCLADDGIVQAGLLGLGVQLGHERVQVLRLADDVLH